MSATIETLAIAAGGRGTRMRELSEETSKHLVEVYGKPFLYYGLLNARKAGFSRIVIVVEYMAQQVMDFVSTLDMGETEVVFVKQSEQVGEKYGTAAVVEAMADAIGRQPFVSFNADGLFTVEALHSARVNDGYHHLYAQEKADVPPVAVVEIGETDMMTGIGVEEDFTAPPLMNTALYTFQPEIVPAAYAVEQSPRGEYEITDAINVLCKEQRVKAHVLHDAWIELGRPEDISAVESFITRHNYA